VLKGVASYMDFHFETAPLVGKIESIRAKNGLIIKRRLTVSKEKMAQYAK